MHTHQNRRSFLAGLSATGAASLLHVRSATADPLPEITSVRLPQWIGASYCWAGAYFAGELIRAEGLTDIRYVQGNPKVDHSVWIANGETDFSINFPPLHIRSIESGVPIKILTGLHSGCLELIANNNVQSVPELKGKRVGVYGLGGSAQVHLSLMAAYVGLNPNRDIQWLDTEGKDIELFTQGKIDAFLATPPRAQKARAGKIGHVILNSTTDPPWSQQFCCMISARAEYVDRYPIATKRILRAMFKAADLCASDPQLVARQVVDRGFLPDYEYALETLKDIRYDRWRDYDPEASLRFYALRMQEIGMIKSSPQKIIADGTDWRFLNELKRELKT
jgi:NitT/TauT family transport system substrate-binding protein